MSSAAPTPEPSPTRLLLTEAQIVDITCDGIRVTQTGLPEGDRIEVKVSDPGPPTSSLLAEVQTRSGTGGTIDVVLRFPLRGHERLHVEVEDLDRNAEYGETGTDLGNRCEPSPWPRRAAVGGAVAVALGAPLLVLVRRRSRRAAGTPRPRR